MENYKHERDEIDEAIDREIARLDRFGKIVFPFLFITPIVALVFFLILGMLCP